MPPSERPHYLETTHDVYRAAANRPDVGLCCTTTPVWRLPGLSIPQPMLDMNYGCGTTLHPRDLAGEQSVLYVGVGGGMELLQFAYFTRRPRSVIGVDVVEEMIAVCRRNLVEAEASNDWFQADFVEIRSGDARQLPVETESIDIAAQNCLFNIFEGEDLDQALREVHRVLRPHGRFVLSDPVCDREIPAELRQDPTLRALCLSGALPVATYLDRLTRTGFGTIEVRARRPYRILSPREHGVEQPILIESVEICAIKDPVPADGPCVFTGKCAIYFGADDIFDDDRGHVMIRNTPLAVCDKTAAALGALDRDDLHLTASTWHYDGGGCC
ncbi:MAG: arsenosugar biosynthesis arsenite methyltransferase ArsM [Candidatus Eisenbacteria bacterium]|nr:arsenosugar biosynthesis arsenite methyltransferase ArsM [Candidatus Eisenbacteria bacterium]